MQNQDILLKHKYTSTVILYIWKKNVRDGVLPPQKI